MAETIAGIALQVTAALHASPSVYSTSTDPLRTPDEITKAVIDGDRAVVAVILDTKGHRSRNLYRFLRDVSDGQSILKPAATAYQSFEGGVLIHDGVGYKEGIPVSPGTLAPLKRDPNANQTTAVGYYTIQGSVINYIPTAQPAKCEVIDIALLLFGATLQSPEEYAPAIFHYAMGECTKYGAFVQAAAYHMGAFNDLAGMIRSGATSLTAPTPFTG